jgi:hypothetical protein
MTAVLDRNSAEIRTETEGGLQQFQAGTSSAARHPKRAASFRNSSLLTAK